MKKILIILTVLVLGLIAIFYNNYNNDKIVLTNNSNSQIINSNTLTMMYETDYQSGEYQVSSDTVWPQDGYTFNERLSKCENGGVLSWDDENKKVLLQTNTSDKCYVYFDKDPVTLASYIINNVYTGTDGENGLYYHDGIGSYTNSNQEAGDYSYRYSGANPNNYVCFGSDELICPEDNLYRIIGVFDGQVKLIKKEPFINVTWGGAPEQTYEMFNRQNNNHKENIEILPLVDFSPEVCGGSPIDWNNVQLENYYEANYSQYISYISEINWNINYFRDNSYNIQEIFANEIISPSEGTIYTAKIGLLYVSDYGYASLPDYWKESLQIDNENRNNNNWLYANHNEWSISKYDECNANCIDNGRITHCLIGENFLFNERPTFYLNSDVQYISGSGTQTDPYRIA